MGNLEHRIRGAPVFPRAVSIPGVETDGWIDVEDGALLNTVAGTLLDEDDELYWLLGYETAPGSEMEAGYFRSHYPSTDSDAVQYVVGDLEKICTQHPQILEGARKFALQAMRQNTSGMFKRWHSEALVRKVYEYALGHRQTE